MSNKGLEHGRGRVGVPRGFTLIELMMAITVLAILLSLAVPSFRDASLGSRLTAYANDIVASAQLARSEAIKRNRRVVLCSTELPADPADPATCAGEDNWEIGWVVGTERGAPRLDADGDPVLDSDGNPIIDTVIDVIERQPPLTGEFRITAAGGATTIVFPPTVAGVTPVTFTVCRFNPVGKQERQVRITATGATAVTSPSSVGTCPGA